MATKPKALDLYCSAGGASEGLARAGFDVTGVDINPQPRYPFRFIQGNALDHGLDLRRFDFIWASPPCQAHTSLRTMATARRHPNLIPRTRRMLKASGRPYVIENVIGAPLRKPARLCGTAFGLRVRDAELRRHRLFEASFPIIAPKCSHSLPRTIGVYGEHCTDSRSKYDKTVSYFSVHDGREAMQIGWMTLAELCQAIPPAYSEYIGRQFLAQ